MSGVSPRPSPGNAGPSRLGRVFALVAIVLGLTIGPVAMGPVAAADVGSSVLDGTVMDVAFVGGGDRGRAPDLLTLDADVQDPSVGTVSLLSRASGWVSLATAAVPLSSPSDGSAPWLVQLGPDRFAVLSSSGNLTTSVTPLTVDPTAEPALGVLLPFELPMQVTDAGVADVDADGTAELILLGYQGSFDDPCLTSAIAVIPLAHLWTSEGAVRPLKPAGSVAFTRTVGAAFGEWDGKPGVDLLVHAYEGCPNETDGVEHHHLLAIRLADLSAIVDRPTPDGEASIDNPWGGPPIVLDVDGDGRDEAIIASDMGFKLVDPVHDWARTAFGRSTSALLTTARSTSGGATAVWMQRDDDPATIGVVAGRIVRAGDSFRVDEGEKRPVPDASVRELASAFARLQQTM